MKKILMTFVLALIVNLAGAQYRKILAVLQFENLENKVLDDYGTKTNPVESGAFINMENPLMRNAGFVKLFNSYRWPNGDKISFSKRHSTRGTGSNGIVDVYTLINSETSDTVLLYVDPYKKSEKYSVPKGLIALNVEILNSEIKPVLTQIEDINNSENGSKLILHIDEVMHYISGNFDYNQLMDLKHLDFVLKDKKADKSLKEFLMMSYVMNKYYALAKEIDNEKDYAFEKMKSNYKNYMKVHPETVTGKLGEQLK